MRKEVTHDERLVVLLHLIEATTSGVSGHVLGECPLINRNDIGIEIFFIESGRDELRSTMLGHIAYCNQSELTGSVFSQPPILTLAIQLVIRDEVGRKA